ncbi:MAG TPA: hypothetical protein VM223_18665 [Planctomycetota bacterium]|nr:hypothetical protein [Planctomycetota bacterium]
MWQAGRLREPARVCFFAYQWLELWDRVVRRRLKDALAATIDGMMGNWKVEFASGKSFLLGIVVNDNDTPGTDTPSPIT